MYGKYSSRYAEWSQCYDLKHIELQTIEKHCSLHEKNILDIGCGTGRFLFRVLPIASKVVGIDNDYEAISVLKHILLEQYGEYSSKVSLYNSGIETFDIYNEVIDLAVFSWSFYALDERQIRRGLLNIHSILREGGTLIILQPVGGQFEKIMRKFFGEHENMDEYSAALHHISKIPSELYVQTAKDKIFSEFVFGDLNMICDVLKMFAITEGGCKEEVPLVTVNDLRDILEPYRLGDKYYLDDLVDVFIFKKRG